jgi:hypothetical protein
LESLLWREYWQPACAFFEVDLRLKQRLNRLKKAWLDILRHPGDRLSQMTYCWRYFGLLHHALRIAKDEPSRPGALPAIRQIVGFESFLLDVVGENGTAGGTVTSRNPLFLVGQLAVDPTVPTPRHVPLLMPTGQDDTFYLYRQVQISGTPTTRIFVSPAVDLPHRAGSFIPIDRLARLVSERADPYWKPRANLLARRLLAPLLLARKTTQNDSEPLSALDLGAGTGQMIAIMIERIDGCGSDEELSLDVLPHRCLAPRSQPGGIRRLMVSTVRRQASRGTVFPQFSLRDYFAGVLAIQNGTLDHVCDDAWHLPVRRFNPAALITPSGRSLIAQLMKVSRAIIIEDIDAEPEHFKQHKEQFGLPGTAAVFCTHDGFSTEANYFVVTAPEWAVHIRGQRLW